MARKKRNWFLKLFDMNDETVSASTVFMVVTSVVATIMLLVPAAVLLIEVIFNHTIATDLTGLGTYVAAVVSLYSAGGLVKGWTNYSAYKWKYKNKCGGCPPQEQELVEENDLEETYENKL